MENTTDLTINNIHTYNLSRRKIIEKYLKTTGVLQTVIIINEPA